MNTLATHLEREARPRRDRWRTIRTVAHKEWLDLYRDARLRWLAALTLLLMLCALLFGLDQVQRGEQERSAASRADQQLWNSQGAKDPHAAAHFGLYLFKPLSPLTLADPGVHAHTGTAVWLEAHRQNMDQFRPLRDATLAARLGNLSLAFIMQVVMPLVALILAFSAFSGERERGTLRQLLSLGVRPTDLLFGKSLAIGAVLLLMVLPAFAAAAIAVFMVESGAFAVADQLLRLLWLALAYLLYLGGFVMLALAVSALLSSSRAALTLLLGFWLISTFLVPRLMSDWVRDRLPLPTMQAFQETVAAERRRDFGHDESHPAFAAFRDEVLRQYGVSRIEELPVNFRGLALRKSDETGYAIFDRHFGELQQRYARQERWYSAPGFIFPLLAMQPLSMALAGSDRSGHHHFTAAAEQHRRTIQMAMSEDLIHNSRFGDNAYMASPILWQSTANFSYQPPAATTALLSQGTNLAALLFWAAACSLLAVVAVRRLNPLQGGR